MCLWCLKCSEIVSKCFSSQKEPETYLQHVSTTKIERCRSTSKYQNLPPQPQKNSFFHILKHLQVKFDFFNLKDMFFFTDPHYWPHTFLLLTLRGFYWPQKYHLLLTPLHHYWPPHELIITDPRRWLLTPKVSFITDSKISLLTPFVYFVNFPSRMNIVRKISRTFNNS